MTWTPTHQLTNSEYHSHPAISRSALALVARSPLHYWDRYLNPSYVPASPTPAMKFGTAVHSAVLEPDVFLSTYAEAPSLSKTTKAGKDAWAAALESGKELLKIEELQQIEAIHSALNAHPAASKALKAPGINEASFITDCPITGLQLKCRPDRLLDSGWVIDLKTTQDASATAFAKSVANFGYHVQAAFYLHVLEAVSGVRPKGFVFISIEKDSPNAVQVFRASAAMIEHGTQEMLTQLNLLATCLRNYSPDDKWPAYSDKVIELNLPAWATR